MLCRLPGPLGLLPQCIKATQHANQLAAIAVQHLLPLADSCGLQLSQPGTQCTLRLPLCKRATVTIIAGATCCCCCCCMVGCCRGLLLLPLAWGPRNRRPAWLLLRLLLLRQLAVADGLGGLGESA